MRVLPSDCDQADQAWLSSISFTSDDPSEEEVVVEAFVSIFGFMDLKTGMRLWKVVQRCDIPSTQVVGLLELAKLHIVALSNTGLPFSYPPDAGDEAEESSG